VHALVAPTEVVKLNSYAAFHNVPDYAFHAASNWPAMLRCEGMRCHGSKRTTISDLLLLKYCCSRLTHSESPILLHAWQLAGRNTTPASALCLLQRPPMVSNDGYCIHKRRAVAGEMH